MNFKEFKQVSMFSSDHKENILIYTEMDGSININNNNLTIPLPINSFIKFYPPDTFVFTTTGPTGLQVWDREKEALLYSYNKEELYDHCYSNDCILSSYDDFNIKFYDLRTRYLINSIPLPNIKKLEWLDSILFVLEETTLTALDYRSNSTTLFTVIDVLDFCICNKKCYYLRKELTSKTKTLTEVLITGNNKAETMKKNVNYFAVQSVINNTMLIGLMKEGIKIESKGKIQSYSLANVIPTRVHLSDEEGYLFTKNSLFKIEPVGQTLAEALQQ